MQQLRLAQDELEKILTNPTESLDRRWALICLEDDVNAAVEGYIKRPSFQQHAKWALDTMSPGSRTLERELIESTYPAIVQFAAALTEVLNEKMVYRKLEQLNPDVELIEKIKIAFSKKGISSKVTKTRRTSFLKSECEHAKHIAQQSIPELVNPNDYFSPVIKTFPLEDGKTATEFHLVPELNPSMKPIGNFIVDCFFRRLDDYVEPLWALEKRCLLAVRSIKSPYKKLMESLVESRTILKKKIRELKRKLKQGSKNSLRTSCTILTQIYAAYHPGHDPEFGYLNDLGWLGLPETVLKQSRQKIAGRMRILEQVQLPELELTSVDVPFEKTAREMLGRVAAALGDLSLVVQHTTTEITDFEQKVAKGGLVLRKHDEKVYWEGKEIKEVRGKLFELLLVLAQNPYRSIKANDLKSKSKNKSNNWLGSRKSRLFKVLPASLKACIVNVPSTDSGKKNMGYKLELERKHVEIVD